MTDVTLNLEQFTKALADTTNKTLGWVYLKPTASIINESPLSPPAYAPSVPSVMASFVLVNSDKYRFDYYNIRYLRLAYLLERNGSYEAGELSVIHDLSITPPTPASEGTRPSSPAPFTAPNFLPMPASIVQTVTFGSAGSLGVSFCFMHDSTTTGSQPHFGLAYKITNASPAFYPRLVASYVVALTPEEI